MSTMRELKRQQNVAHRKELAEGSRTQIIKTSTVLPMNEPRNAAVFRVEETRRAAAGEEAQTIPTPDKGKVVGSKGSRKPPRSVSRDPASGSSAAAAKKRPSEGQNPPAKKGKGKMSEAPELDSDAEVARLVAAPELEWISELVAAQRKVSKCFGSDSEISSCDSEISKRL